MKLKRVMGLSESGLDEIAAAALRVKLGGKSPVALDVGAGDGRSARVFQGLFEAMDGVEALRHNIDEYDLRAKYRDVFCEDIRGWTPGQFSFYEVVIVRDVLEHLTVKEAKELLKKAYFSACTVLVQVPFLSERGEVDGNPYERHWQPDLTHELMQERYGASFAVHVDKSAGLYLFGP